MLMPADPGRVAPAPGLPGAPVTCQSGGPWADYQKPWAKSSRCAAVSSSCPQLKLQHPRLNVMAALGGWAWPANFSNAALSEESRRAFVRSCVDLLIRCLLPHDPPDAATGRAWGVFDGIDIDWECPGQCGNSCGPEVARPEDTRNFTLLQEEFRRQLDDAGRQHSQRYQLSIAGPAACRRTGAPPCCSAMPPPCTPAAASRASFFHPLSAAAWLYGWQRATTAQDAWRLELEPAG